MKTLERILDSIYEALRTRRLALFIATMAVVGLAVVVVTFRMKTQENIAAMLPDDDSQVARDFRLLGLAPFSRKVLVTIDATPKYVHALTDKSRRVEAKLRESGVFTRVDGGFDPESGMRLLEAFSTIHPCLFTDVDLDAIEATDEETVREQIQTNLRTLSSPDGMLEKNRIINDPLDFSGRSLEKLRATRMVSGVTLKEGRFVDASGTHALIVADTDIELTDAAGAKRLMAAIHGAHDAGGESDFSLSTLSGHRYSLANEQVIRRDLKVVLSVTVVGLILIFLTCLRHWTSIYVFVFPAVILLLALAATAMVFETVSAITIGFGAVLMGISVDFALHLYFAAKAKGGGRGGLVEIARPAGFCALTTIAAFAVLLQSDLPGQRQLAIFCVAGLVAAVFLAFIVLPHLLPETGEPFAFRGMALLDSGQKLSTKVVLAVWLLLVVAAIPFALRLTFDGDLRNLGARPVELTTLEKEFRDVWGDFRGRAMVFAEGDDLEDALQLNDELYHALSKRLSPDAFSSVAPVLPSQSAQKGRAQRWAAFVRDRRAQLGEWMRNAGWPSRATDRFLNRLDEEPMRFDIETLEELGLADVTDALIVRQPDGVKVITLLPDDAALVEDVIGRHPDRLFFVSQSATGAAIGEAIARDFKRFVALALAVVVLLVAALYRRPRLVVAALVPVISGVLGLFAVMGAVGLQMNMFNVIASILIIGLGVDYGIFMVAKTRTVGDPAITAAVWVSSLTTLAGFGALVLGKHPALFSIGITVVVGIGFAILSALYVVPALVPKEDGS